MTDLNALAEEIGAILEAEPDDDNASLKILAAASRSMRGADCGPFGLGLMLDVTRVLLPFAREGIAARKKQMEARDA